ncbi:hypothetical protein [Winslowiella iniecta]|uniref:HofO family protein n=1 Tax=Winslowiella iniecta TaxID=1560201 RepID=UPI00069E4449|nr:hypothetical protein [Winslowiella iniecta]
MSEWLLRWQYAAPHWQWGSVLVLPVLLLMLLAGWWLQPQYQQRQALINQCQQRLAHYQTQLAQLRSQPALLTQQQRNQQLRASLQGAGEQAFSLVALLAHGAVLEAWQPAPQGGVFTLQLSWPQFQQLMAYLASRQPPVTVDTFQLRRSGERLRMTVNLGASDDG